MLWRGTSLLGRAPLCARRLLAQLCLACWAGASAGCALQEADSGAAAEQSAGTGGGTGAIVLPSAPPPCQTPASDDLALARQGVDALRPTHRILYSWTVPEQEASLRAGERLLSIGDVPGKGKGIAMDRLTEAAAQDPTSLAAAVASVFETFRYAWPNPWATRLGFGGEDYGDRLLRIELDESAWIGVLAGSGVIYAVYDLEGNDVPLEEAAASPERIAALYFVRDESSGGPVCGSFAGGGGGYREFIVGNEALVKRWSIGTEEILERLDEDISALTEYFHRVRPCPPAHLNFNVSVLCDWRFGISRDVYIAALALPDAPYLPTAGRLTHLIETLEATKFEPDPLVVEKP